MVMGIDQVKGREIFHRFKIYNADTRYMDQEATMFKNLRRELEKEDITICFDFRPIRRGYNSSNINYYIYKGKKLVFSYSVCNDYIQWTNKLAKGDWLDIMNQVYAQVCVPKQKDVSVEELYSNIFCKGKPFVDEAREIIKDLGHGVIRTINEDQEDEQSFSCDVYDYDKLHILIDRDTPLISISFEDYVVFNSVKGIYCPGKWEEVLHFIYEKRHIIPEIERNEKDFEERCQKIANEIYLRLYHYNSNNPEESTAKANFYKKELEKCGIRIDRKYRSEFDIDYSSSTTDYYVYKDGKLVFHERYDDYRSHNMLFEEGEWLQELKKVFGMNARYTIVESTNSTADDMILAMKKRFDNN